MELYRSQTSKSGPASRQLLIPLSWLFSSISRTRNHFFESGWLATHKLPVPVVSVGNLSVGGTGKTPVVARLATHLRAQGRRPAIVTRGYGGTNARGLKGQPLLVSDGRAGPSGAGAGQAGDEAVLLAGLAPGVPVVACRDRHAGGLLAITRCQADMVLLDDGFQHRRLARTLDILTLDAEDPFCGGRLLPAGNLRESPHSLERAQAVVVTRANDEQHWQSARKIIRQVAPAVRIFRARHRPVALTRLGDPGKAGDIPLAALAGAKVMAFAGLARPRSLEQTLAQLGAHVMGFKAFRDHHRFSPAQLKKIVALARRAGAEILVTTAKDAVRLDKLRLPPELHVLHIEAEIEALPQLGQFILSSCGPHQ